MRKRCLISVWALAAVLNLGSVQADPLKDKAFWLLQKPMRHDGLHPAQQLVDFANEHWVQSVVHDARLPVVFLAMGNEKTMAFGPNRTEAIRGFLKGLRDKGHLVVYDADVPALQDLVRSEIRERYRLGISARSFQESTTDQKTVSIANPFMRLSLLRSFKHIYVTPDSTLGVGLLMEGIQQNFHLVGFGNKVEKLVQWTKDLSSGKSTDPSGPVSSERVEGYGITYSDSPSRRLSEWLEALPDQSHENAFISPYSLQTQLEFGMEDELGRAITFNKSYLGKLGQLTVHPKSMHPLAPGAVLFGSGSGGGRYQGIVESAIEALARKNRHLATGGDGGYMSVAHQVATKNGLPSFGIPIGHSSSRGNPIRPNQSHTVYASDYSERIPLLLSNKNLILVVPGGLGTMREVATTLVQASFQSEKIGKIVFLDGDYYGGLVRWLHSLALPEGLKEKIILARDAKSFSETVELIEDEALGFTAPIQKAWGGVRTWADSWWGGTDRE